MEKKDFKNAKEFKEYKKLRDEVNNAQKASTKTQALIDNFKAVDPEGFEKANNLTYKDKSGKEQKLDIRVSSDEVKNVENAETTFTLTLETGLIKGGVISTKIDNLVKIGSNVLAHEFGHAIGIASNPLAYAQAFNNLEDRSKYDCQDVRYNGSILSVEAIKAEKRFDQKLKEYKPKK